MTDETGKLPYRKRELFSPCDANLKDFLFSVCSVSGTGADSKEAALFIGTDNVRLPVTGLPEVPCCRLKPKFSKVAVSKCVRILDKMIFVSCTESVGCFFSCPS